MKRGLLLRSHHSPSGILLSAERLVQELHEASSCTCLIASQSTPEPSLAILLSQVKILRSHGVSRVGGSSCCRWHGTRYGCEGLAPSASDMRLEVYEYNRDNFLEDREQRHAATFPTLLLKTRDSRHEERVPRTEVPCDPEPTLARGAPRSRVAHRCVVYNQ